MKISKNKVVSVSYELEVDGSIADKAPSQRPLEYIHGTGMLLPKFEAALESKESGDAFSFTLSPEDGYGEYNPKYKVNVPKSAFEIEGKLREDLLAVGRILPMYNSEGQVVQGRIESIEKEHIVMDFNHPMAGKTLNFSGKVEAVRDASEKELKEGLHGEYLPREEGKGGCCCGGGGSCKEGGCDCDGEGGGGCCENKSCCNN